jgi:hypothetical protein
MSCDRLNDLIDRLRACRDTLEEALASRSADAIETTLREIDELIARWRRQHVGDLNL